MKPRHPCLQTTRRRLRLAGAALWMVALPLGCAPEQQGAPGPAAPAAEPIDLLYVEQSAELLPQVGPLDGRPAAAADLDGDGLPDIVQPTADGVRVYWNDGGSFTVSDEQQLPDLGEGSTVQTLAGDMDGDGRGDLVLLRDGEPNVLLLVQGAQRSFAPPEPEAVQTKAGAAISGALVDLDADGNLDVVVTLAPAAAPGSGDGSGGVELLMGDGTGRLAEQSAARLATTSLAPYGVAAGDIDGDGHTDLLFTGDGTGLRLLLGDGQGMLRDAPADALPAAGASHGRIPALGDLDGDGSTDVLVPGADSNQVLLNDGTGRLRDATPFVLGGSPGAGERALIADLDLDGRLDAVLASPNGPLRLYRNDGSGRLFDYTSSIVPQGPSPSDACSVSLLDAEGDGDPDLFVSRSGLARPWLLVSWHPGSTEDQDGDGVPDAVDSCPEVPNAAQDNRDASHFACASGSDCAAQTGCQLAVRQGTHAYLLCGDAPLPWAEARAFCQARGADLLVIGDAEENAFVAELGLARPWIGLSDAATEGSFLWVDGQTPSYLAWADQQPDDAGGVEDCVELLDGPQSGTWNDADCSAPKPFICEDAVLHLPADPGDACDTCPGLYDPLQEDSDDDGIGDACAPQ